MIKKHLNLDPVMLPSDSCVPIIGTHEFKIGQHGQDSRERFFNYVKEELKDFDFTNDNSLYVTTCEGFMFLDNVNQLVKTLHRLYDSRWLGKTTLSTGNWYTPKLPKNFKGLKLEYNTSFSESEIWKILKNPVNEFTPNYERSMEKIFLSLHAACRIDRTYIFDHLFRNHYDTSTNIYRMHIQKHYENLRNDYEYSNHVNDEYSQIFEGEHPIWDREYNLLYCWHDFNDRLDNHFVNVVSETNFAEKRSYWFTEKTVVPILQGMPFLTTSTVGYYDLLHRFGIKTFSDFWDESFSNEENHMERLEKYLSTLDYIANKYDTVDKRKQAISDMKPILEHNRETLKEIYTNGSFRDYI